MPWSPSSVADFMACPRLWYLKRQGVQGRERDMQARDMGTEFHALMAAYWRGETAFQPASVVVRAAHRTTDQEGDALREHGVVGVEVNLNGDDVEAARHGRYPGTCDLITDNGAGLTVTDYKTKLSMAAQYADRELRQTQRSWQLMQYAYYAQAKYGRLVTHMRKLLVAFGPSLKVWLVTYPITQHALSAWYKQAEEVWSLMDACVGIYEGETDSAKPTETWQNAESCERFGWEHRCDFYSRCWEGDDSAICDS